jgi:lipid A 3-O-deacylase
MRFRAMRLPALALVLAAALSPASAEEQPVFVDGKGPTLTPETAMPSIFSEFRLGGFAHNIDGSSETGSFDINGEILFNKPLTSSDPWIDALLPRPHVGATVNLDGKTSAAYAGLTWTFDVTDRLFVEGSFGASINNGITGPASARHVLEDRARVGCSLLFRESASIGFNITDSMSIMGTIEHHSNADLCDANGGLTNFGLRFGYKF